MLCPSRCVEVTKFMGVVTTSSSAGIERLVNEPVDTAKQKCFHCKPFFNTFLCSVMNGMFRLRTWHQLTFGASQKLCGSIVGSPPGKDWTLDWYEVLHQWNIRLGIASDKARIKPSSRKIFPHYRKKVGFHVFCDGAPLAHIELVAKNPFLSKRSDSFCPWACERARDSNLT